MYSYIVYIRVVLCMDDVRFLILKSVHVVEKFMCLLIVAFATNRRNLLKIIPYRPCVMRNGKLEICECLFVNVYFFVNIVAFNFKFREVGDKL